VLKDDGTMARRDDLYKFAQQYNLPFIHIGQIMAAFEQAQAA
jgi:3,4-dihydroxy-2-butanone 4-phosphate synthase